MGLHLCYELALPNETTAIAVAERMTLLHKAATRLPFDRVSSLVRVTDGEALGDVGFFNCSLEDGNPLRDKPYVSHWHSMCKTQYASVVSDEHLIHCHTTLVALLEEAIRLGFDVTVRDETHYWETRDTNVLLAEVREMNRIVARIARAFQDAAGGQVHLGGAIFEHREFEVLETKPAPE